MTNASKELARLARKRRKEQLQLDRGIKRTRTVEETCKASARLARRKRKEKLQQLKDINRARRDRSENNLENNIQASSSSTTSTSIDNTIWNFGKPTYRCHHCNAVLWYEERLNSNKATKIPSFGICCK